MNNATTDLTIKEQELLAGIERGMDEAGCGWLHEIASLIVERGAEWATNEHAVAGVLGSLKSKGLVHSDLISERFVPDAYWVTLAD